MAAPDRNQSTSKTKSLKPVEAVTFSTQEMLTGLFAAITPSAVASINQLHGDRKGVVRITCRTTEAALELDSKIASRRVLVNGVRMAPVGESGHFIHVTLYDVPHEVSSMEIERELRDFGSVVHIRREYIEYQGYKIENETRHVLFSELTHEIPPKISLDGQDIYVQYRSQSNRAIVNSGSEPLISQSKNIPKHVMTSIVSSTTDGLRRTGGTSQNTPRGALSPEPGGSGNEREEETKVVINGGIPKADVTSPCRRSVSPHGYSSLQRRVWNKESHSSDLSRDELEPKPAKGKSRGLHNGKPSAHAHHSPSVPI